MPTARPAGALAVHKQRSGASALLERDRDSRVGDAGAASTSATTPRAIRGSQANNHPIRHGAVVGIHNGIIVNDEELLDRHGFDRAAPEMTVDSEAIFALVDESGPSPRALERAARLDGDAPGSTSGATDSLYLARGVGRPLWIGEGADGAFFASTAGALEIVERYVGIQLRQREVPRGGSSRSRTAPAAGSTSSRPTAPTASGRCRPCARRASATSASPCSPPSRLERRLPAQTPASPPLHASSQSDRVSAQHHLARRRGPLRAGARGPGTGTSTRRRAGRRTSGRPATRSAARGSCLRAAAQSANFGSRPSSVAELDALPTARSSRSSSRRHVEARLAQRRRERAERVPVERLRRHRACGSRRCPARSGRGRARSPSSRRRPSSSSRVANRRGTRPAARLAAFQLPKCSITVCGCTVVPASAANSRIVGERPSRSAQPRSCVEDLLVRVALADPCLERLQLRRIDPGQRWVRRLRAMLTSVEQVAAIASAPAHRARGAIVAKTARFRH